MANKHKIKLTPGLWDSEPWLICEKEGDDWKNHLDFDHKAFADLANLDKIASKAEFFFDMTKIGVILPKN